MVKEFLSFILNKKKVDYQKLSIEKLLIKMIKYALLLFLIVFIFSLPLIFFQHEKYTDVIFSQNIRDLIISSLILAPIYEELIYRGPITGSKKTICLFISSVFIYSNLIVLKICDQYELIRDINFSWIGLISQITLFFTIYVLSLRLIKKKFFIVINSFLDKNLILLIYVSASLFALSHFSLPYQWSYFFSFFPLFISGLFLTYVRIKNGLIIAIAVHAIVNAIKLVLS